MTWRTTVRLLLFAAVMVATSQAQAWGPDGHAIVAAIAEARLDPAIRAQVAQLLSCDQTGAQHLDQIASWADAVRTRDQTTGPWHFVDIPLQTQLFDPNRDCAGGNCVVAQIRRFASVLANRNDTPQHRLDALKFLVHFVGDIHQPLHCETDFTQLPPPEGDRGGNLIHFNYFGHRTNLHAYGMGHHR
jgi:nuclease S1